MKEKLKLKLLNYWMKDCLANIPKIPENLKNKISDDDVNDLLLEMDESDGRTLTPRKLADYKRTIESHMRESPKGKARLIIITAIITAITLEVFRYFIPIIINFFQNLN